MTKQKRILSLAAAVIMTSTSLTATGVYASDVSHEHDCGIDSYAQELMASGEIKDYTQAPYYYALEEWFDFYGYTLEERERFMEDTETLNWMLYNGDYWNDGNLNFLSLDDIGSGIEKSSSPTYPVSGHEAGTYFSKSHTPCTHHGPSCSYTGGCDCISVNNSIQCLGFANFVRWARTGSYLDSATQILGLSSNWSVNSIKNYFQNNLNVGSHVRLRVSGKSYDHSITIVSMDNNGVSVYDCNMDGQCGVQIHTLTWNNIYQNYDYIRYSNVYAG